MLPPEITTLRNIVSKFNSVSPTSVTTTIRPTLYECAVLSNDVYYKANDPTKPPLPEYWCRYTDTDRFKEKDSNSDPNGYFGACYIKDVGNGEPACIVFAHRGTAMNNLNILLTSLLCDGQIFTNWFVNWENSPLQKQFFQATEFMNKTAEIFIMDDYHDNIFAYPCFQVGHSLGGVIANLMSLCDHPSITFENPGSKQIIDSMVEKYKHDPETKKALQKLTNFCKSYQADVNCINTCCEQMGQTYRLVKLPYDYTVGNGPKIALEIKGIQNLHYIYDYTLRDQHKILNICDYLKNSDSVAIIKQNLVGMQNGYIAYLDIENRLDYWQGYFKSIWDKFPEIRDRYENKLELYLMECYSTVRNVQDVAKKSFTTSTQLDKVGFFSNRTIDLDDFVVVDKNNPGCNSQEKYKTNSCSII